MERCQRVYRYWKVESSLTLLKATIGVAAGIKFFEDSWYALIGTIEGTITGEVILAWSKEAEPTASSPSEGKIEGKVTGEILGVNGGLERLNMQMPRAWGGMG